MADSDYSRFCPELAKPQYPLSGPFSKDNGPMCSAVREYRHIHLKPAPPPPAALGLAMFGLRSRDQLNGKRGPPQIVMVARIAQVATDNRSAVSAFGWTGH